MGKIEKAKEISGILNAFKHEPLKEEELDEFFYKDTMRIRTGHKNFSPVRKLFEACKTPSTANAHLFMGHMGCGKSAELRNLKRKFEEDGYFVHMVDTLIETDPNLINYWDILILITEGLCKIAKNSNASVDKLAEPLKAISDILFSDIEVSDSYANSACVGISSGGEVKTPSILSCVLSLFAALKSDLKLSEEKRTTVTTKMPKRASEWLRLTKEISFHLTAECNQKHPIIIFEDLDKIPFPEKIFQLLGYPVLAQMPFPVIYTFPIDQSYSNTVSSIGGKYSQHVLPMIKVKNKDNSPNKEGVAVIKEIVGLRSDLGLFEENVLEKLIEKTGGSLRHLFMCITDAARLASWDDAEKIRHEDAERALSELSKELTKKITVADYLSFKKIIESKEQIEDKDFLLKMMHSSIVLEYENGERWNDVHPLVADFVNKHTVGKTHDR